jgi:hypothetical protein
MRSYEPAIVKAVRALEESRTPESELEIPRRRHRQHVAAARARSRELRRAKRSGAHRITRPAVAIWAIVDSRR